MHLRYFSNEVNCPHDGRIPLFLITFVTSKFNTNRNKNIMLKTILSISGKPGLYKLVSHGKTC